MKMPDADEIRAAFEECTECGLCQEACDLLREIEDTPGVIAQRGPSLEEAFGCNLCGRCQAACPVGLDTGWLFAARRQEAVRSGEIDTGDYEYLFPDSEESGTLIYRRHFGIDYSDLPAAPGARTGFFPGCTLGTYSPGLTRAVFERLQEQESCVFFDGCCGKPLEQMGLAERAETVLNGLLEKVRAGGVERLVLACPGCYYTLRHALKGIGVEALTIFEALDLSGETRTGLPGVTIHDSCPDRQEGIFASQAREALRKRGYNIKEMDGHREESPCCGSGGQVSHFRPDRAQLLVEKRLEAATSSGAGILAAYCLSCTLNFARIPSSLTVRHVLNLLLDHDEEYAGVKDRAAEAFMTVNEDE